MVRNYVTTSVKSLLQLTVGKILYVYMYTCKETPGSDIVQTL